MREYKWESMGTFWSIKVWDEVIDIEWEKISTEIFSQSYQFDSRYSRFIGTSLVTQMSKSQGKYFVGNDFVDILKMYFLLEAKTGGQVTPCMGNMISDFGYDAKYSLKQKPIIRAVPKMNEVLEILDEENILIKFPLILDIGAVGKGFFVDKIANFLKTKNIKKFLVDGSGDMFVHGVDEGIRIGLEDPLDEKKVLGILRLKNGSLCASGINKRVWGDANHYMNPRTGGVVKDVLGTFVVAENAFWSDALASCLFFVDPNELLYDFDFEWMVVGRNKKIKCSDLFLDAVGGGK